MTRSVRPSAVRRLLVPLLAGTALVAGTLAASSVAIGTPAAARPGTRAQPHPAHGGRADGSGHGDSTGRNRADTVSSAGGALT